MPLPSKLTKDAVIEALLEVQFDSNEISELAVGQLAAVPAWSEFRRVRLPVSDIPEPIRSAQPGLRHQPTIECVRPDRGRVVRLGSRVLSYHAMAPYPGWTSFRAELNDAVDGLFTAFPHGVAATRIGLRYVNGLNGADHGVAAFEDLALTLTLAERPLGGPKSLAYQRDCSASHGCTMRVASPEFVSGTAARPTLAVLIDAEVATPPAFRETDRARIRGWIEDAHAHAKAAFFELLKPSTIERLREN